IAGGRAGSIPRRPAQAARRGAHGDQGVRVKIRAAVLEEFGAPLVVQEVELAEPKAGEVLVRLEACGVCHTDMYTASGADPSGYAPAVLGHEGAPMTARPRAPVSVPPRPARRTSASAGRPSPACAMRATSARPPAGPARWP